MALSKENLSQRKLEGYLKWCEIIRWGRRNPVKFAETFLGIEFMDYQRYVFMNSWDKQFVLWVMTRNGGKALSLDTEIPTPYGIKEMRDIKIGDYVFNENGISVKVINTSETFYNTKCYRIKFDDGEEIIADENHLWEVSKENHKFLYTTSELFEKYKDKIKYTIPNNKAIHFPTQLYLVKPYDLLNIIDKKTSMDFYIPSDYLIGDIKQREELLQGIMDIFGEHLTNGKILFKHKSKQFSKQVCKLLSSLGLKNKEYNLKNEYIVEFYSCKKNPCFRDENKIKTLPKKINNTNNYKTIESISETITVPTKCIMVDGENSLYLCGKKNTVTHNSTLSAPFAMTKMMLFPNFESYILSLTSAQSQDTFMKLEKIAKAQIESFTGLTNVFFNEIIKSASNTDGFTHSPQGFKTSLFNGSKITSLSGAENNLRGKRSNLNIYDESGFVSEEYVAVTQAFTTQNASFKLGGDTDSELLPKSIPNQLLFCSSASSIDSYFYSQYKEYSKKMFAGSNNHFVADINCDVVINATNHGKKLYVPLLTQEKVDEALSQNKEKALREYYNKFTSEGGSHNPIKRAAIIRNSKLRKPVLKNEDEKQHRFLLAYDPARSYDNSIVTIGEIIKDNNVGYKLIIQNMISLVDIGKKNKTPMRTPEQMEYIKQLLLDYNGKGFADYENIEKLMIDSGSGGGGVDKADYFMEDWNDKKGIKHKGLIDKEVSSDYVSKFPNASDKIMLISPRKYKTDMYDAFIEMLNLDLIEFTETYDMKDTLLIPNDTTNNEISYTEVALDFEDKLALKNIDLSKEEAVQTYRRENTSSSTYSYDLDPDKKNKMHDDRMYTLAMLAWYLKELRREGITKKKDEDIYTGQLVWY